MYNISLFTLSEKTPSKKIKYYVFRNFLFDVLVSLFSFSRDELLWTHAATKNRLGGLNRRWFYKPCRDDTVCCSMQNFRTLSKQASLFLKDFFFCQPRRSCNSWSSAWLPPSPLSVFWAGHGCYLSYFYRGESYPGLVKTLSQRLGLISENDGGAKTNYLEATELQEVALGSRDAESSP